MLFEPIGGRRGDDRGTRLRPRVGASGSARRAVGGVEELRQEVSTLTMTLRYMHLAPSALTEAIDLLNFGQPVGSALSRSV